MLSKKYIHNINKVIVVLGISLLVASCGTYEYVGYNNDGIYSEVPSSQRVLTEVQTVETVGNDAGYYKNYFQERKKEIDATVAQSDVFTDVDDYSSDYSQAQDSLAMRTGYSGWGQTNDVVNINFYNNGWNNWGWDPWLWGPGWGWNNWRWGVGWNAWGPGWGWNRWGVGWGGWGWNAGFGWGGFYGTGWGWGYPGWGVGGFYPYNNNVAFMGSRRGDVFATGYGRNNSLSRGSNINNSTIGRRSSSALPANSNLRRTVEQNNLRRSANTRMSTRNTINSRNGSITRSNGTRINNTSRSSSRVNNTSSSSRPTTTTRSSSSSRSSGGTMSSGGSRGGSMGGGSRGGSSGGGGRRGG